MKYIYIIFLGALFNQIHFTDIPSNTGENQAIIIEQCIGLDVGDEIGIFDSNGLISSDCSDQYNEILVGSGVYNGEQLFITGIGSFDYCDLEDGYQMPGWINGNSIIIKVWDASQDIEYIPNVNYITGNGYWGEVLSIIDVLTVDQLSLDIIDSYSLLNLYPNPFNNSIIFDFDAQYQNNINISIYDLSGKMIFNTIYYSKDKNSIIWDASSFKSGIYFVKFSANNLLLTKKITLLK